MAEGESNSLIDWSGPVVEYINKPLIPLPMMSNQIDLGEDNPFDAVERQINENELFDMFNINLSFNENDDSTCEEDVAVNSVKIKKNLVDNCQNEISDPENCSLSQDLIDDDALLTSAKKNENDPSKSDSSIFSSLSDFKEMVQSRISYCVNQALNSSLRAENPVGLECGKSASVSQPSELLNNCFIQQSEEFKNCEIFKNVEGEYEDLQSIKLEWDEYLMSSSEDENEKPSLVSKPKLLNQVRKTPLKTVMKVKDVRTPLICQDPNIRIKKSTISSKQGPLKAVVPVPILRKCEDRKSTAIAASARTSATSKIKVTSINLSKVKKWRSPMATSTPQNYKNASPNVSRSSLTSSSSNSSFHQPSSLKMFSYPPSPDSTSDSKIYSRMMTAARITPKKNFKNTKNVSSNEVSSSTKNGLSNSSFKTSKDVGSRSFSKGLRNKENLKPFRN